MRQSDIEAMSSGEKIRAIETLWDSLLQESHEPVSPAWHNEVLSERKQAINEGKAVFLSLDKLRQYGKQ